MKKTLSLIALLLCVLLTVSCSTLGNAGETTKDDETTLESPESTKAPEEETTAEETTAEVTTEETTEETTAETTEAPKEKLHVALGDSICRGYGLNSVTSERYSALLKQSVASGLKEVNYGVDGYTSTQMLTYLNSGLIDLENAALVTLSIGANNILGPGQQLIPFLQSDAAAAYQMIRSPEFLGALDAGVQQLATDLPAIVNAIRKDAPDAKIVLLTIYNPYKGASYPIVIDGQASKFDIGAFCSSYITAMNEIIASVAAESGCVLADVYTEFENSTDRNVNVTLTADGTISTSYDPHPNKKGHRLIAAVIEDALLADSGC